MTAELLITPPRGFLRLDPDWDGPALKGKKGPAPFLHLGLDGRPFTMDRRGLLRPLVRGGAVTASGNFYLTERDIKQNDTAVDWLADTLKHALFTNTITPNFGTDTAYGVSPYNANEVGTPAGGVAVASDTISLSTNTLVYDGADTAWASQTFSGAVCGLLYDDTITTPVADPALLLNYFGGAYGPTSGVFTLLHNAAGIFTNQLFT